MKAWIGRVPDTWHEAMLPYRHVFFSKFSRSLRSLRLIFLGTFREAFTPGAVCRPTDRRRP